MERNKILLVLDGRNGLLAASDEVQRLIDELGQLKKEVRDLQSSLEAAGAEGDNTDLEDQIYQLEAKKFVLFLFTSLTA
jgi:hypothetical protein